MGQTLFATVLLAGMLFGSSAAAAVDHKPLGNAVNSPVQSGTEKSAAGESAIENGPKGAVEVAAVDYCYAGSIMDPTTGESVDLFVLCEEDGLEQNIDLA